MIYAKIDVDIIDHPRATAAGREARDLWVWGILFARKHQTNGVLTTASVAASSWGAGGKKNLRLARKLTECGLWAEHEEGFVVLRYAEKNDTKEAIEERRNFERSRKASQRTRVTMAPLSKTKTVDCPSGTTGGTPTDFPGSGSGSYSASGSIDQADRDDGAVPPESPPNWWDAACSSTEMAIGGEVADRVALWLEYRGSRHRKTWAMNQTDAVAWISNVVRAERRGQRGAPRQAIGSAADAPWMNKENFDFGAST